MAYVYNMRILALLKVYSKMSSGSICALYLHSADSHMYILTVKSIESKSYAALFYMTLRFHEFAHSAYMLILHVHLQY